MVSKLVIDCYFYTAIPCELSPEYIDKTAYKRMRYVYENPRHKH